MMRAHEIVGRLSWLPAWMLLLGLLVGQTGVGFGLLEVAASEDGADCAHGCPCETDAHAIADDAGHDACPDGSHGGCPPDCDDCACCAGVAAALAVAEGARPFAAVSAANHATVSIGAPHGVSFGVFQPPERPAG